MGIRQSIDAAIAAANCQDCGCSSSYISNVLQYCKEARLVFEIGAFTGLDIPEIHRLWPDAAIHCFEPMPEAFEALLRFKSEHIVCNNSALTNRTGQVTFYQMNDAKVEDQTQRGVWFKTAGSLHHAGDQIRDAGHTLVEAPITVSGITLDDYCAPLGLKPDILLLDTQGSEYEIFEGAVKTLKTVKVILCEWSTIPVYEGQKLKPDLTALLKSAGFDLKFEVNQWSNFHGDAVYVRCR